MGCSHNCESCSGSCGHPECLLVAPNKLSTINKVIAVVSGKGGVGKSLATSMLAVGMCRKGYHTAILDADITGPSIPKAFGMSGKLEGCEEGILPKTTDTGIDMISINFLLDHVDDPVVYRGPIIAETVKQFWSDVIWPRAGASPRQNWPSRPRRRRRSSAERPFTPGIRRSCGPGQPFRPSPMWRPGICSMAAKHMTTTGI